MCLITLANASLKYNLPKQTIRSKVDRAGLEAVKKEFVGNGKYAYLYNVDELDEVVKRKRTYTRYTSRDIQSLTKESFDNNLCSQFLRGVL